MRTLRTDGQAVVESEVLFTPSPSSRGPGRGPFKAKTRVRIPLGTPVSESTTYDDLGSAADSVAVIGFVIVLCSVSGGQAISWQRDPWEEGGNWRRSMTINDEPHAQRRGWLEN